MGGGDGFGGSTVGNPGQSDMAKITGDFTPVYNANGYGSGHASWQLAASIIHKGVPNGSGVGGNMVNYGGMFSNNAIQTGTGVDRQIMEWGGYYLALGAGAVSGTLNVYDTSWNLLVTGPSFPNLGTRFWGWEWNAAGTQVRIWVGATNSGWQTLTAPGVATWPWLRARERVAGKSGGWLWSATDFMTFDRGGARNNQWPSTYPQVIELVPTSDDGTHNAWTTPASNKYQRIDCPAMPAVGVNVQTNGFNAYQIFGFQQANVASCGSAIDISSSVINAVRLHAGFEEFAACVGNYAALEGGTLYDGPAMGLVLIGSQTHQRTWTLELTPSGLAWTPTLLDAIRYGAKSLGSGSPAGKIDRHYRALVLYGGAGMDAPAGPDVFTHTARVYAYPPARSGPPGTIEL